MKTGQLIALAFVAFGCGPSSGDDDANTTLSVDPPTSELWILDGVPATASFTATLTTPGGGSRDVTNEVRFSVDEAYGSFAGNALTLNTAGKTPVFAALTDKLGQAAVSGRVKDTRVDPSLPPGAKDWFDNPEDPARAPTIVYPPADVVMPRNLGDFEVHWTDTQNNVFEVSLKSEFADVRAIVPGGNGAIANGSWMAFLAPEWLAAVSYESSVQYQARGVDQNNPISVGAAAPRLVRLSNEPMLGGLYYWAATAQNGPYGIFRHDMSKPGQPAEQFMTTAQTNGRCVACHVLSRDGTKMAITYDGGNNNGTMIDVASKVRQPDTMKWNFATFTPDGNRMLTVHDGQIVVRDSTSQAVISMMPAAAYATHPDISPDGTRLVYIRAETATLDWSFTGGKVFTRTYDSVT